MSVEERDPIETTSTPADEQEPTQIVESVGSEEDVEYDDPDDYIEGGDVDARYIVQQKKHSLLNTVADSVETPEERLMTPWELIVATAKAMNVEIGDPKKGCKHCFGRGWTGLDSQTKNPVVCHCVFPARTPIQKEQEMNSEGMRKVAFSNMSREQRRKLAKKNKKQLRKMAHDTFAPQEDNANV